MRYFLVTAAAVLLALAAFVVARSSGTAGLRPRPAAAEAPVGEPRDALVAGGAKEQAAPPGPRGPVGVRGVDSQMEALLAEVKLRPNDHAVYLNLGRAQGRAGRLREARKSFEMAYKLEPRSIAALYGIAQCCQAEDDFQGMLDAFRQVKKVRPDEPGIDQKIDALEYLLKHPPKKP